jgi:hypothetical protein
MPQDVFWKEKIHFTVLQTVMEIRNNTVSSNIIVLAVLLFGWTPNFSFCKGKFKRKIWD